MFKRLMREKHHQTVILWVLLAVLILPMVLFFNGNRQWDAQGPGGTAGVIFGRKVPWEQYERERQLVRRSLEARLGGESGEPLPDVFEPYVREQTWDRILLQEEARREVKVSDHDVATYLQQQPTFQTNGRFDRDLYFRYVRAIGYSPRMFEDDIRNDLRIQRLIDRVKSETRVSEDDLRAGFGAERQRIRAALAIVDPKALEPTIDAAATEPELIAFYTTHLEVLQVPARRAIDYLGLSAEEARASTPDPDGAEIGAYYDANLTDFKDAQGNVQSLDQARDQIRGRLKEERVQKRLKTVALDLQEDTEAGMKFDEIATKRGLPVKNTGAVERTSPGTPGGPTGIMINDAFDTEIGSTTRVFETAEGVYLLRPATETPSRVPPYDEVKGRVRQLFVEERAREAARERSRQLHDELATLLAGGKSADDAAAVVGVELKRPLPFDRQGPTDLIGYASPEFGALLELPAGQLSEPFETPQGWVVGLVEERLPFDETQFAAEKDTFRTRFREMKEQEHVMDWLESLRERARLKSFLPEIGPSSTTPPAVSPSPQGR